MLNSILKQQISAYLGNHEVISPQLTALFNCISEAYNEMENRQAATEGCLTEMEMTLEIYKQQCLEITYQFENSGKLPFHQEVTNGELTNQMLHDEQSQKNLLDLVAGIGEQIRQLKSNSDFHESRINELEKINRELDQFAYTVSHDLKSPLRAVASLAQWIEDDLGSTANEQVSENFRLLRNRVFRMEGLINAILIYSKSSKTKIETQLTDTGKLLDEIIDSLNCPQHISIQKKGNFPIFNTESIKLQQVFANLLSNSIKYIDKEKGIIEIGYFEMEDKYQFYVEDNGPGIEQDFKRKAFLLFHTKDSHDDYMCAGIGLAIVKKIIDEGGGKIWIESENGQGARFVFLWPKKQSEINQNNKPCMTKEQ